MRIAPSTDEPPRTFHRAIRLALPLPVKPERDGRRRERDPSRLRRCAPPPPLDEGAERPHRADDRERRRDEHPRRNDRVPHQHDERRTNEDRVVDEEVRGEPRGDLPLELASLASAP